MIDLVVDTNILVSGLLSPKGPSARLVDMILGRIIRVCYDERILEEYREVLSRSKFQFGAELYEGLLHAIRLESIPVVSTPIQELWVDEGDKKFYEVALAAHTILITGNRKHYPKDNRIIPVSEFLELIK